MVINLAGPPGSGKSTFASRYVLRHPEWNYIPIDAYRAKYKEEVDAWFHLQEDLKRSKKAILESSGLSWRLEGVLRQVPNRNMFTIYFFATRKVLRDRVKNRQKRNPHLKDEIEFIDYALEQGDSLLHEPEFRINTSELSIDDMYRTCSIEVSQFVHDITNGI